MLLDYLYEHWRTGERIFVECEEGDDPEEILLDNEENPENYNFLGTYTPEEADILGYDTY